MNAEVKEVKEMVELKKLAKEGFTSDEYMHLIKFIANYLGV